MQIRVYRVSDMGDALGFTGPPAVMLELSARLRPIQFLSLALARYPTMHFEETRNGKVFLLPGHVHQVSH